MPKEFVSDFRSRHGRSIALAEGHIPETVVSHLAGNSKADLSMLLDYLTVRDRVALEQVGPELRSKALRYEEKILEKAAKRPYLSTFRVTMRIYYRAGFGTAPLAFYEMFTFEWPTMHTDRMLIDDLRPYMNEFVKDKSFHKLFNLALRLPQKDVTFFPLSQRARPEDPPPQVSFGVGLTGSEIALTAHDKQNFKSMLDHFASDGEYAHTRGLKLERKETLHNITKIYELTIEN